MNEILIKIGLGTLGAGLGILLYRIFGERKPSAREQELLNARVEILDQKENSRLQAIEKDDAESKEKVKVIEDEQNKEVTPDNIVDFFNNRKP